jgi:hypothetical protein
MISQNKLTELVRDWLNAWNAKDINRLMNHYHENIEFNSPNVVKRWNNESGKLAGKEALRKHFLKGFEDANHISFELLGILKGTQGIILVYRKGALGIGADTITLDDSGKALTVSSYTSID